MRVTVYDPLDFEFLATGLGFPEGPVITDDGTVFAVDIDRDERGVLRARPPVLASSASIDDIRAEVAERWYHNLLGSRALTISDGFSEITHSLVGRRLLGLPRA